MPEQLPADILRRIAQVSNDLQTAGRLRRCLSPVSLAIIDRDLADIHVIHPQDHHYLFHRNAVTLNMRKVCANSADNYMVQICSLARKI